MKSTLSHKAHLFTRTIPVLKEQSAYFSIDAVKRSLSADGIELADNSLRKYLSQAMSTGLVSDAGRGWYSRHSKPVTLAREPVAKLIKAVSKAFPLLDFCCWSTTQCNPFALHLIAQPTNFLYAEEDTLESVGVALREAGWDAWVNPGKSDAERFVRPGAMTVVLRPSIAKQPTCNAHVAPIEKALVDLTIEANKLQLMDQAEVQRILDSALGSGLLKLPVLFGYAETKRVHIESKEIVY
ncbi:DUF6577 family protein [Geobacter sp.]|uniref:DUF6577 family protein n=1 Tax=Geobacter sp. TaxID=46610 RepID=UPI00261E858E|nr:DUF6577 family protein [Geobacter sp.]